MQNIFDIPPNELGEIFSQTANKMGMGLPIIVEKDFWIVKLLQLLFSEESFFEHHVFKGGTSLSKCYGLIQRFSEDLDITISRSFLGFNENIEQVSEYGSSKRKKYFDELELAAESHVKIILDKLHQQISDYIKDESWDLYIDSDDPQKIIFEYPRVLSSSMYSDDSYVKPAVLIEFGCRGDLEPANKVNISTYIEECFSDIFAKNDIVVNALCPERTFWEKVTLLHMLYHQDAEKPLQLRMARHYYDSYKLLKSDIGNTAVKNTSLLDTVAKHKSVYFKSKKASYETAKPGSLKVLPHEKLKGSLLSDYGAMDEMFFGNTVSFQEVLSELTKFEQLLNSN